jgi:signal transduction histidine kinase
MEQQTVRQIVNEARNLVRAVHTLTQPLELVAATEWHTQLRHARTEMQVVMDMLAHCQTQISDLDHAGKPYINSDRHDH